MKTVTSKKYGLFARALTLVIAFVLLLSAAGCYKYNGPDYESDASDFKNLSYTRPKYDRFNELHEFVLEKSGSFFEALSLRNAFLEMYDIYVDVMAMSGLVSLYNYLDMTNEYYADEAFTIAAKSVDIHDKLWEACDALVHGAGGWILRNVYGLNSILESFGGDYSTKDENAKQIDGLKIEEERLLYEYQNLLTLEYGVDGSKYDFLYEIPDKAKNIVDNGDGTSTWIITEEEAYTLYEEGYISLETFAAMLQDINSQKVDEIGRCYLELVKTRNSIAELAEPGSNYYEYAYKNSFHRDFTPEDLKSLRELVKSSLFSIAVEAVGQVNAEDIAKANSEYAADFYNGIIDNAKPIFEDISGELAETLDTMVKTNYYDIEYLPEKMDMGFTSYLPVYDKSFLYIQPSETPTDTDVSTFFHEFGHYFHQAIAPEAAYNNDIDSSEVLSQAMELIVSKYYGRIYPQASVAGAEYNYLIVKLLENVLASFLIDEFEERVYSEVPETPEAVTEILMKLHSEYGYYDGMVDATYWVNTHHLFLYPGYYISYAVSAIAAANIYFSDEPFEAFLAFCDATRDCEGILSASEAAGINDPLDKDNFEAIRDKLIDSMVRQS